MLRQSGAGIGALALTQLLGETLRAESVDAPSVVPRAPHFAPRAKRLIHIFANGGPSQVDTFDPKPLLKNFTANPFRARSSPARATRRRAGGRRSPRSMRSSGAGGAASR